MDVHEAAYRVAHDFKGGVPALAARMGKNPGTLFNRLNPNQETHHLTLEEATVITYITADVRVPAAMLLPLGFTAVKLPDHSRTSDVDLLQLMCERDVAQGALAADILEALTDGEISVVEFQAIESRTMTVVNAALELLARLRSLRHE